MSQRRQYNDCYLNSWNAELAANAADDGVARSGVFDTVDCFAPTVNVNVRELGNNKKIAISLEESDSSNAGFTDVANLTGKGPVTDALASNEISENGGHTFYYAGLKRYIRLKVTSKSAAPAAKLDILFQKHILASKPRNTGF